MGNKREEGKQNVSAKYLVNIAKRQTNLRHRMQYKIQGVQDAGSQWLSVKTKHQGNIFYLVPAIQIANKQSLFNDHSLHATTPTNEER